jgi:tetrahydromethanopterin S-methyltransferase subunit B
MYKGGVQFLNKEQIIEKRDSLMLEKRRVEEEIKKLEQVVEDYYEQAEQNEERIEVLEDKVEEIEEEIDNLEELVEEMNNPPHVVQISPKVANVGLWFLRVIAIIIYALVIKESVEKGASSLQIILTSLLYFWLFSVLFKRKSDNVDNSQ